MLRSGRVAGVLVALVVGACAGPAPDVPLGPDGTADAVLVRGREVFTARCVTCHGSDGGGGRGPALSDGRVGREYPDIRDQIAVVTDGRRGMPSFGGVLTEAEIEAVVRYTREVL